MMNRFFKGCTQCVLVLCYFLLAIELLMRYENYIKGSVLLEDRSCIALCILYIIVVVLFIYLFEGFNIRERRLLDLIYGHIFSAICSNGFFAVLICALTMLSVRDVFIKFLILMVVESVAGSVWVIIFFYSYLKQLSKHPALFVYGNREDSEGYIKVNNEINNYFSIVERIHYEEGIELILEKISDKKTVLVGDIPFEQRNTILKYCLKCSIECFAIPKVSDIYIQNTDVLQMHDKMLFKYRKNGLTAEKRIIKRITDIIVSLILLIVSSPIMLFIAVLIKLEDGQEILFRQTRVTEGNREFEIYKFRSMRVNAEINGAQLAKKNDDRVTKVGRVIRNIHFDELPQLINILKGDMSIVGPRPERREFIETYLNKIPEFSERLKVRAGLTGYAQIYGKYNSVPEDKIKYDLMYIYNYSLRLDLKLILLTIRILFQKENTEGVDSNQISAIKTDSKEI